jgi:hypothetical protein
VNASNESTAKQIAIQERFEDSPRDGKGEEEATAGMSDPIYQPISSGANGTWLAGS